MPGRATGILSASLLISGCLFGGSAAPGRVLIVVPELLGLALLAVAVARATGADRPFGRPRLWVVAIVVALPAIQLVPLPPLAWASLPGRTGIAEAYGAAGMPLPWLPISLTPRSTERFLLQIIPSAALVLAIPQLAADTQRRLLHLAVGLGVLDAVLGLVQVAGGPQSPFRFYDSASRTDAVGFFANRNHHAAFLALTLVFAGALLADRRSSRGEKVWLGSAACPLLLGIASAGSRAGLLLGLGASLAAAWCILRGWSDRMPRRSRLAWIAIAVLPFVLGLLVFGTAALRVQPGAFADDLRWQIARTTWRAITDVFPVGSGFGSFTRVYALAERPDEIVPAVVNNAHLDWLELVLEGGLPALVLLAAAAFVLVRETLRDDPESGRPASEKALRTAALAVLWLCALHSCLDYPLRTMSTSLMFALACGLRIGAATRPRAPEVLAEGRAAGRPAGRSTGSRRTGVVAA